MISNSISSELISGAEHLISAARHVVILTHMSPDGDAMGSSLAMYHYLRQRYVAQYGELSSNDSAAWSVDVIVPNTFPAFLAWLPGAENDIIYEQQSERASAVLAAADLVICTDFGEAKRVGALESLLAAKLSGETSLLPHEEGRVGASLVIDHHLHPTLEPDVLISVPEASSASELVFRLIYQLNARNARHAEDFKRASLNIATCLYCGIMTDTGNFQFSCADPELYEIVSELLKCGIDKIDIYDRVFNSFSEFRLRLTGYCLNEKMQLLDLPNTDVRVSLIALNAKELERFHFQSGDAEGIVNMPMQITEVKYSCFMREDTDKIKISLRSQGNRPVNLLAHDIFSGGGHMNASGGEFRGTLENAVEAFKEHYQSYFHS